MNLKTKIISAVVGLVGFSGFAVADTQIPISLDLQFEQSCLVEGGLSFNNGDFLDTARDYGELPLNAEFESGFTMPEYIGYSIGRASLVCSEGAVFEVAIPQEEFELTVAGSNSETLYGRIFYYLVENYEMYDDYGLPKEIIHDNWFGNQSVITSNGKKIHIEAFLSLYRKVPTGKPVAAGTINENLALDIIFH